jgi:acetolactate synthase-1/2/3 large subunit
MILQFFFSKLNAGETVVTGNGTACVVAFQTAVIKKGTRLFTNSGSASMGYDIPAAIGASIANNSRVILITGDGSIMQNIQELQLISYLNLPIKIIVLNNNGYSSIKQTQINFFQNNQHGYNITNGVSFPDFRKVTNAFEIPSLRITTFEEWEDFINLELYIDRPFLVDLIVSDEIDFHPKLASYRDNNGNLVSPAYNMMSPLLQEGNLFENEK